MNAGAMLPMAIVGLATGYLGATINPSPQRTGLVTVGELSLAGAGFAMKSSALAGIGLGAALGSMIGLAVTSASGDARAGAASIR